MNPFKREQHLVDEHTEQMVDSPTAQLDHLDSDEARALHTYFHQGDFIRPDHDHPENDL
jgi:hypothetical protein